MARRLRLHFAARRSNTDPLSETSEDDLDNNIYMHFKRPSQNSASSVIEMKLTPRQAVFPPVMQEIINQQQSASSSSLQKNNKKSTSLQISLQSRKYSGCLQSGDTVATNEDSSFTGVGNEGNCSGRNIADYPSNMINTTSHLSSTTMLNGSLGSIAASDNGSFSSASSDYGSCTISTGGGTFYNSIVYDNSSYRRTTNKYNSYRKDASQECLCRSNTIFDQDGLEQMKLSARRKTKVPLRRCSSLVIFPRSPSSTPPMSPTQCVAYQTSHKLVISPSDLAQHENQTGNKEFLSTAVNGLRLSKSAFSPGEVREIRPLYLNTSLQAKSQATDSSEQATCEETSDGFSCISVHLTQKVSTSRDEMVNSCGSPESNLNSSAECPHLKLTHSTSACLPSKNHSEYRINENELKRPNIQMNKTHHFLQRSMSLEGSCQKVSCYLSSLKYKCPKAGASHLHIQFRPGNEGKTNGFKKRNGISKREMCNRTLWKPLKYHLQI
ncbi:E3 ubiquitin-protein ligase NEDD4-like [Alligator sinensis]|uniref:E3 ubiquitin-protein ligase NEDD4-like n=1 Tax=Alligator sinensis TaxID=38654 RepID=A0A3Q0G331_ALLSI|nr:E3 ubiquitin-protein ligase NEDD4-like [Alligator sinensis]